jgi:NAD(P)-dependent dehydrogenase (short-subunit alcohol dehydrogenase family)
VSASPKNCHQGRNVTHPKETTLIIDLDVLVHNSGNNWGAPFEEYVPPSESSKLTVQPDAAWNRVLGLNLQRPFTLTQKLYPLLKNSPSPRIIHIGSISAIGVPGLETYAYSASKAGLHHLSQVLAVRLGKEGFTVNTIACGPFESKMMKETLDKVSGLLSSKVS